MDVKSVRLTITATAVLSSCLILLGALLYGGCGGAGTGEEQVSEVVSTVTAFLDACGNLENEAVRSFLSQDYLESNQVPDPITREDLIASLGYLDSYRLAPDTDVSAEGGRAVVAVTMVIRGKGENGETIVLCREGGEWKVDGFTAMDWTSLPATPESERVLVEEALRDFIIACIDQRTDYIFEHLSDSCRKKYRLEKPWTTAEFSGIFGTARSYEFDPGGIAMGEGSAEVDVTIEFGSRGNLESETAQVRLVKESKGWTIDAFPFFIY